MGAAAVELAVAAAAACMQGTRKQNRVCFLKVKNSRLFVCFRFVAEGKQEGLWEGSGHSGQGAAGGHAGTRHE